MDTSAKPRGSVPTHWVLISIVAVFAVLQAWRGVAKAEPMRCDVDLPHAEARAIMLGTSWCPYCAQTRAFFNRHEIAWCEYDIERTPVGKRLHDDIGVDGIPVIVVGEQRVFGFNEPRLRQVLEL